MLSAGGSLEAYRATLGRLGKLLPQAKWVIPGHGDPMTGERAGQILAEDLAYLEQLQADPETAKPPESRTGAPQRRIHAANLAHRQ